MTSLLTVNLLENLAYIITVLFLFVILSYYLLFFIKGKKTKNKNVFSSITIIIPAHNEERYLGQSIESVLDANFKGRKEIIVVDDGSKDDTAKIAAGYRDRGVKLISISHSGKSNSINKALKSARGEIIAIVDGDSIIHKDALEEMASALSDKDTAAACGVVKVKNRKRFVCFWVHIEQIYNSLMRLLMSKINANVTTPGPLSMYRKNCLLQVGGFSTEGFSEDIDITIKLIRAGYKVKFAEKAVAETNMPEDTKNFLRQRFRFARGMINLLKRHMQLNNRIIDVYTLPIFLFTYVQAIVMGIFTLYQLSSGYIAYFTSKGVYFSPEVLRFFFDWFSIIGFVKWAIGIFQGHTPLTFITIIGIISTLLTYPLYFIAIWKFDKKFDLWHLIPIFFMFPYWLFIMIIYIISLPEYFRKDQPNIWKKNE